MRRALPNASIAGIESGKYTLDGGGSSPYRLWIRFQIYDIIGPRIIV